MTTYLPQKKIKTEVEIKEDKQTNKQRYTAREIERQRENLHK
jgi:hypothetical protein